MGPGTALAVLLATSGAWLTHATGRLEYRGALMALTVFHQAGSAVWLGGLVQLGVLWRLARRSPEVDALWPDVVARFSRLALVAVIALVASAVPLVWVYAGSLQGLLGTGYGSLVVTKGDAPESPSCCWRRSTWWPLSRRERGRPGTRCEPGSRTSSRAR